MLINFGYQLTRLVTSRVSAMVSSNPTSTVIMVSLEVPLLITWSR